MKDRRVNSDGEIEEWERPRTIPDDFTYDPVRDAYLPPGEYADESQFEGFEEFCAEIDKIVAEMKAEGKSYLVSADEVRAWKAAGTGESASTGAASPSSKSRKKAKTRPDERQRDLFADLEDDGG